MKKYPWIPPDPLGSPRIPSVSPESPSYVGAVPAKRFAGLAASASAPFCFWSTKALSMDGLRPQKTARRVATCQNDYSNGSKILQVFMSNRL